MIAIAKHSPTKLLAVNTTPLGKCKVLKQANCLHFQWLSIIVVSHCGAGICNKYFVANICSQRCKNDYKGVVPSVNEGKLLVDYKGGFIDQIGGSIKRPIYYRRDCIKRPMRVDQVKEVGLLQYSHAIGVTIFYLEILLFWYLRGYILNLLLAIPHQFATHILIIRYRR